MYYLVGIIILIIAFFMGTTQHARGYNFWQYFILSNVVLWVIFMMLKKAVTGTI